MARVYLQECDSLPNISINSLENQIRLDKGLAKLDWQIDL
jgi:hypothetical protein